MAAQSYSNHIRFYPLHHFVFLPLAAAFFFGSAYCAFHYAADRTVWLAITAGAFLLLFLGIMLRQHYALGNQDRIVRLEMRLRYYQLTGKRFEPLEASLSFGQIAALRFAGDEELPALADEAIRGNLPPDEIKKRVKAWLADDMRL